MTSSISSLKFSILWIMVRVMWCSLVLVLYYHPHVYGKEGILKEGTIQDWFKSSSQVNGSGSIWDNPDTTGFNYSKTEGGSDNSDFWLITNYADIKNKTTIIYVEIEYKIDLCKKKLLCNLTVYVHKGKDPNIPRKNRKTYLYSNFYLLHVIKAVTGSKTKTRFKLSNSGQYITFGISAKAVDATVYGIKMFYYYCEGTSINNIYFPNTTSSANQSKAIYGNCSENSKFLNNGTEFEAFCLQNGTWTRRNGSECLCVAGFEPRSGCQPCMTDHFKSAHSNDPCTKCPEGNRGNDDKTTCTCKYGKYNESPTRGAKTRCFGLPSQVRRLTVENIPKSTVILIWDEPLYNEFSETLKYDVECYSCSSSKSADCKEKYEGAKYYPGQHNLTTTSVTIYNLKHDSKYKFKVYSKNMILKPSNVSWKFTELSISRREVVESLPKSKNNTIVLIIPLAIISSLLLIMTLLVIFRKKLVCCRGNTNQNENNVSVAQLQQPDPVINISAETGYDHSYENTCEDSYEHPYAVLSKNREPENEYQHLELTTDHVQRQASESLY